MYKLDAFDTNVTIATVALHLGEEFVRGRFVNNLAKGTH